MLTVAAGAEARLEKGVGRKRAVLAPGLKIPEMAEMALVGVLGIGEIQPRQRIAIIAVDCPVDVLRAEPAENARAGKNLDVIVEMTLAGRRGCERTIWNCLRRSGGERMVQAAKPFARPE